VVAYQRDEVAGEPAVRVFISVRAIPVRLLVVAATEVVAAVACPGTFGGYHVRVWDARPILATAAPVPRRGRGQQTSGRRYLAREAAERGIDERTTLAVPTHDPKFGTPLLRAALGMAFGYLGLLGSRRTCQDRWRSLVDSGVPRGAARLVARAPCRYRRTLRAGGGHRPSWRRSSPHAPPAMVLLCRQ
jgi:xanthine dehydrogenase accessory factor